MKKVLTLMVVLCLLCFSGCDYEFSKMSYYANTDNYITVSGTVEYINYFEMGLCIAFSDLSESFDDDHFIIKGKNYNLVIARGIKESLSVGKTISFTTAPRYFGDGYMMPIVAITIDDVVFLDFDEGYANLNESLKIF